MSSGTTPPSDQTLWGRGANMYNEALKTYNKYSTEHPNATAGVVTAVATTAAAFTLPFVCVPLVAAGTGAYFVKNTPASPPQILPQPLAQATGSNALSAEEQAQGLIEAIAEREDIGLEEAIAVIVTFRNQCTDRAAIGIVEGYLAEGIIQVIDTEEKKPQKKLNRICEYDQLFTSVAGRSLIAQYKQHLQNVSSK